MKHTNFSVFRVGIIAFLGTACLLIWNITNIEIFAAIGFWCLFGLMLAFAADVLSAKDHEICGRISNIYIGGYRQKWKRFTIENASKKIELSIFVFQFPDNITNGDSVKVKYRITKIFKYQYVISVEKIIFLNGGKYLKTNYNSS